MASTVKLNYDRKLVLSIMIAEMMSQFGAYLTIVIAKALLL
jgi:hypothetical protein